MGAAVITGIYAKLASLAVIVLLLGSAYAYAHHQGAQSQKAADAVKLTKAATALDRASDQLRADAATFRQITAATDKAQAEARAAAKRAASAVAETQAVKEQADRDAAAFAKQLDAALNQPECHALKEQLCKSAMGY